MYDRLKDYKSLLDEGIITEAEFEKKKRELLGLPDKEAQQRAAERQKKEAEERQKAIDEAIRLEAEHKRKIEEDELAQRAHQRKLEEAQLAEQERQRQLNEQRQLELEQKKKEKAEKKVANKGKHRIVGIAVIVLVVIAGIIVGINVLGNGLGNDDTTDYNAVYEWPESGLANNVPKPTIPNGEISTDSDTTFSFYLYKATSDDFRSYANACQKSGYTVIEQDSGTDYCAYNEDKDRHIEIDYYEEDKEIYVVVSAPEQWTDIYWPKSKLAKTLPIPETLYGLNNWDDSDSLNVDIANISSKEFNSYVDKCIKAGYNVDYSRDETSFSANDGNGNELYIDYGYFNVMNIDLTSAE